MLSLHPFSWEVVDEAGEEGSIQIQCWCLDRESKPSLVRIEDYPATCFIELPTEIDGRRVNWFDRDVDIFMKSIFEKLGGASPISFPFSMKPKLYYYQKTRYPMIHLTFNSLRDMRECVRIFSRPYYFKGKGRGKVQVWENKIPLIRKFLTRVHLEPSQWFSVDAKKVTGKDKISYLEEEYITSWKNIKPLASSETKTWMVHPKILSFDIEAYSRNHKAFPDKYNTTDVCYMISVITQRIGLRETRDRKVIIFGDSRDIENVEIIRVNSEIECIDMFAQLVKEADPEIVSGYNHHGFDNDYMDARLERVMEEWREMGRIIGQKVEKDSRTWASAAYGHNEVTILKMGGRISIDMLPVVKRDYKLPRYDLDTVGKFFLKTGKHPVKAEDIFNAYEQYWSSLGAYEKEKTPQTDKVYQDALDEMTRITRYCLEDAELTLNIAEKIHIWISSVELSNIVGVSIVDLYTRGQQIRCLSKIYDEAHRQGYVVDFHEPLNVIFNGGAVEKPKQGIYDMIPCYDFASLYPSIIDEFNIDYTTYVPDHLAHTVKDEDCNIIEFDQLERPKKVSDKTNEDDFDPDAELGNEAVMVHRRLRFVKKSIREGVVPKIVHSLVDERRNVKKEIALLEAAKKRGEPVDEIQIVILNQRQNALKISTNSYFGFFGAFIGLLPLIEAAMAVTAKGREMIGKVKDHLINKYGAIIIYGDTDSTMPRFPHLDDKPWEEKYAFWKSLEQELSDLFPGRIALEMEKVMRIICFAPKMYAYLRYDKDGNLPNDPTKVEAKGIVLARRDGTPWARSHYRAIIFNILWNYSPYIAEQIKSMESSFDMIVNAALELQEGRVDWQDLAKINEVSTKLKSPIAALSNHLRQMGRPAQAGDRLRYLICDIPGAKKVGDKMRTDDEFLESQKTDNPLRLDVNYYLENALLKKIDPLFQVGYNTITPFLEEIGYKPNSLKHFVSVIDPVRMIARCIEDGKDITDLKKWFKEHLKTVMKREEKSASKKLKVRRNKPDYTAFLRLE